MTDQGKPPVRELLPFDEAWLEGTSGSRHQVNAKGTAPGEWMMYEVEPNDEPGIPEPEWLKCQVVGYHFADYPPRPTPYQASAELDLPPGAKGFELEGKNRTERLTVIFNRDV